MLKATKTGLIAGLLLCLILISSIPVFAAGSPQVTKIEVQEYPGQLQVNIYSNGQVQYKVVEQKKPDKSIILDIFPATVKSVKTTAVNIATVKQIRVGQFSVHDGSGDPDIVRVIIDLTKPTEFQAALSNNGKIVALAIDAPGVTGPDVFAQAQSRPKTVIQEPPAQLVSCDLKNADLSDVLKLFSDQTGENIILGPNIQGTSSVTIRLEKVPLEKALNLVLRINDLDYRRIGNVIVIDSPEHLATIFPAPQPPEQMAEEVTTQVINLEYADAQSVATSINSAFPNTASADNRIQAIIVKGTPEQIREIRGLVANLDVPGPPPPPPPPAPAPPVTQVFKVKYAKASEVQTQLGGLVPPGSVIVDTRLNSLIVTGSEATLTTVKDFLASVDVAQPQVSLELKVLEVSQSASKELGINWSASVNSTWTEVAQGGKSFTGGDIGLQTFTRTPFQLNSTINFLLSSGKSKLLANPRITTMDGLAANIHLGDRIPLVYYDPRAGLYQATYIDVGVVLNVTPVVNGDGYITTQITPEVSSVTNFIQNFPQVTTRTASTTVRVKDGDTIIIGGLLSDNERVSLQKIPILGDIPIIGALFRNKKTTVDSTEVVFMVTPRVLKY